MSLDSLRRSLADRYRIEHEIGAGGMATVYLADDLKHHRKVAIKVLRDDVAAEMGAERFHREITTTANLRHPHIMPLYDSGEVLVEHPERNEGPRSFLYYVMPHVAGRSLRERIDREKQLPVDEAVRLTREVADALGHAHSHGVVHRDIKPDNILIEDGHAVVTDFGIAKALSALRGTTITRSGTVVGTPQYMSPEQAAGDPEIDPRSDIYSLGCVLYEMLAGQTPFTGPTTESVVHQHLVAPPPPITQFRPSVPGAVSTTIERALQKVPADRFADARSMALALTMEGPAQERRFSVPLPGVMRRARWTLIASGLALVLVGGLVWRSLSTSLGAPGDIDPAALVILPFEVRGSGDIGYLREGMVDLLSTKLDGLGGLRVLDPRMVLSAVGDDAGAFSPKEARALAARLGAAQAIAGSVTLVGNSLQVSSSAYSSTASTRHTAVVEGPVDSLFALVDRLVTALVADGIIEGDPEALGLEALTTESNTALRLYLDGVSAFRAASTQAESHDRLARAVSLDSTFALASLWAGIAAAWFELPGMVEHHLALADRHRDRLGTRDQLRLSAALASADGRHADALPLYASLVERYPEDVLGWFAYAEELAHSGPYMGLSLADARPAYERAFALDPGMTPAAFHLANLGGVAGDSTALRRWAATLDSLEGEPTWPALMRLMLGVVTHDSGLTRQSFAIFRSIEGSLPASTMASSTGILAGGLSGQDVRLSRWFLEEYRARALTDTARAIATRRLIQFEVGAGRFRQARELLEQGDAALHPVVPHDLAFMALHPSHPDPIAAAREAHSRLAETRPPAGSGESAARHFLLASLDLRLGNQARFRAAQTALASFPAADEQVDRFARDLAFELEAMRQAMSNDPASALHTLLQASYWRQKEDWLGLPSGGYFEDVLYVRPMYLRAELLLQRGDSAEAARWYSVVTDVPWYRGPALRALANLEAAGGKAESAVRLRQQLLENWSQADPGVNTVPRAAVNEDNR